MIRRRAPLKRSPLKRSRKPIPRKRAKPRRGPLRDPGYLDYLRSEGECVACAKFGMGRKAADPAHGPANGRSSKGPDNEAIPLCRWHHEEETKLGWLAFGQKYLFNWMFVAAEHYARYQEWKRTTGVITE